MSDFDYDHSSEGEMLTYLGTDGAKWAEAFCHFNPHLTQASAVPGDAIHGWFCNAIEAGRSAAMSHTYVPCRECEGDGCHGPNPADDTCKRCGGSGSEPSGPLLEDSSTEEAHDGQG